MSVDNMAMKLLTLAESEEMSTLFKSQSNTGKKRDFWDSPVAPYKPLTDM